MGKVGNLYRNIYGVFHSNITIKLTEELTEKPNILEYLLRTRKKWQI